MNFQISDLKNHDYNLLHTNLSGGFPSPTQPHSQLMLLCNDPIEEHAGGNNSDQDASNSATDEADQKAKLEVIEVGNSDGFNDKNDSGCNSDGEEESSNSQDADLHRRGLPVSVLIGFGSNFSTSIRTANVSVYLDH
ncbi:hypothetical protein OROMI_014418 [Orobanche minor]